MITGKTIVLTIQIFVGKVMSLLFNMLSRFVIVSFLSHVQLFVTSWTITCQAPLSMEFSWQEYWSGLLFPSAGDLPNPGIKPGSSALEADSLHSEPPDSGLTLFAVPDTHWGSWKIYPRIMGIYCSHFCSLSLVLMLSAAFIPFPFISFFL